MKSILYLLLFHLPFPTFCQPNDLLNKKLQGKLTCLTVAKDTIPKQQIRIRCGGTLPTGSKPLIILDGIPLENEKLSAINPNNIQEISILKTTTAQALYGSRAEHGVILIKSKKVENCRFQVLDATDSLPVSGASVEVRSEWSIVTAVANKEGNTVYASRLQGKAYRLSISSVGYLGVNEVVRFDSSNQTLPFFLRRAYPKMDTVTISGGLYGHRCRSCGLIVTFIHNHDLATKPSVSPSFAVWPNPVRRGESVTIIPPQNFSGSYQVLSGDGRLLQTGQLSKAERQTLTLTTSHLPAGVCFIRFIDRGSEKMTTQKIIVQ